MNNPTHCERNVNVTGASVGCLSVSDIYWRKGASALCSGCALFVPVYFCFHCRALPMAAAAATEPVLLLPPLILSPPLLERKTAQK